MAWIVMGWIVMAYIVMAYIVAVTSITAELLGDTRYSWKSATGKINLLPVFEDFEEAKLCILFITDI